MKEIPVLNSSKAPEAEFQIMECTLIVENTETVGDISTCKRVELDGYVCAEVLQTALDLMHEVIA